MNRLNRKSAIAMIEKLLGNRYKVIKVLGSGGFSRTYIAQDMQRPGYPQCVVKQFQPANQDEAFLPVARRLFYTEAETLEKLGKHDQIPRLLAYFEENEQFYLVQELIEGHPLSDELQPNQKQSEAYVIELLEDLLGILEFVHAQGAIHRDIKPSNLIRRTSDGKLVLIDFGAVKAIRDRAGEAQVNQTVVIGTKGYMPNEQLAGQPRFNSDIYAAGAIAIQALTGMSPSKLKRHPDTGELNWRDGVQVSDHLAEILDNMVRGYWGDRYQSATEVLQAIKPFNLLSNIIAVTQMPLTQIPHLPGRKLLLGMATVLVATGAVFAIARFAIPPTGFVEKNVILTPEADEKIGAERISFGRKILMPGLENPDKQEGVKFMAKAAFDAASSAFTAARKTNQIDPEILIYLNNARIGNKKSYAIAAAVPVGSTPESASEMLRGVAQAQDEINAVGGINGVPLKVAIADDNNQPEMAQAIAKQLVKNPDILGVVGHGISDTTLAAGSIYQTGELVAIAPISSAVQLSGFGRYVFRTMPSDRYTARALSTYMLTQLKKQKAAIFFNSNSVYSQSLKNEFKAALFYQGGGQIVGEFDLYRPDFKPGESVETAIKQGAETIVLLPSNEVADRALQVVRINRQRLKLLAGDGFYIPKTLEIGGEDAAGMVLAVPGSLVGDRGERFRAAAFELWGGISPNRDEKIDQKLLVLSNPNGVSWRTALAYDATQALIESIRQRPDRQGVQRSLSAANFSILGVTGTVSFRSTGDRESAVQLVTITPTPNGYRFKPLN